jgi:hypothetical protein
LVIRRFRVFRPCLSAEILRFRWFWAKEWTKGI